MNAIARFAVKKAGIAEFRYDFAPLAHGNKAGSEATPLFASPSLGGTGVQSPPELGSQCVGRVPRLEAWARGFRGRSKNNAINGSYFVSATPKGFCT